MSYLRLILGLWLLFCVSCQLQTLRKKPIISKHQPIIQKPKPIITLLVNATKSPALDKLRNKYNIKTKKFALLFQVHYKKKHAKLGLGLEGDLFHTAASELTPAPPPLTIIEDYVPRAEHLPYDTVYGQPGQITIEGIKYNMTDKKKDEWAMVNEQGDISQEDNEESQGLGASTLPGAATPQEMIAFRGIQAPESAARAIMKDGLEAPAHYQAKEQEQQNFPIANEMKTKLQTWIDQEDDPDIEGKMVELQNKIEFVKTSRSDSLNENTKNLQQSYKKLQRALITESHPIILEDELPQNRLEAIKRESQQAQAVQNTPAGGQWIPGEQMNDILSHQVQARGTPDGVTSLTKDLTGAIFATSRNPDLDVASAKRIIWKDNQPSWSRYIEQLEQSGNLVHESVVFLIGNKKGQLIDLVDTAHHEGKQVAFPAEQEVARAVAPRIESYDIIGYIPFIDGKAGELQLNPHSKWVLTNYHTGESLQPPAAGGGAGGAGGAGGGAGGGN